MFDLPPPDPGVEFVGQSLHEGYRDRPVLGKPYREADLVAMLKRLLRPQ